MNAADGRPVVRRLIVPLVDQALPPLEGYGMTLNDGLNHVRFTSPVPSDSRIRGRFRIEDVEDVTGGKAGPGRRDDRA
jgi:acyl dehydratase